jgi:hypothetical protein
MGSGKVEGETDCIFNLLVKVDRLLFKLFPGRVQSFLHRGLHEFRLPAQ